MRYVASVCVLKTHQRTINQIGVFLVTKKQLDISCTVHMTQTPFRWTDMDRSSQCSIAWAPARHQVLSKKAKFDDVQICAVMIL